MYQHIKFFKHIALTDLAEVGGKNASLGEMYQTLAAQGINLPNGFATTAGSYYYFLDKAGIKRKLAALLQDIDVHNVKKLKKIGAQARALILYATLPEDFTAEIC